MNKLLCLLMFITFSVSAKVRVAIIDTGIDTFRYPQLENYLCKEGHLDVTGRGMLDVHDHGSNVAALIAKEINPEKACLVIIKYWHTKEDGVTSIKNFIKALEYVKKLNPEYLNISLSGESSFPEERQLLNEIKKNGTKIVVASGNGKYKFVYHADGKVSTTLKPINLKENCLVFPACYQLGHNFFVVKAKDLKFANFGYPAIYEDSGMNQAAFGTVSMTGTSQAAANFTGKLVRKEHP